MTRPQTPALTADIIIELSGQPTGSIVMIERKNLPYGWALPGGFVDIGETLEQAAVREAKEEVCLDVKLKVLLGCYSDPARDERGHTVSAVYVAEAEGIPRAADDAKNVSIVSLDTLPAELAFDHRRILADYAQFLQNGRVTALNPV